MGPRRRYGLEARRPVVLSEGVNQAEGGSSRSLRLRPEWLVGCSRVQSAQLHQEVRRRELRAVPERESFQKGRGGDSKLVAWHSEGQLQDPMREAFHDEVQLERGG